MLLKNLHLTVPPLAREKSDLIHYLASRTDKIQIVEAPPPVTYDVEVLQRMSVKELRQVMEQAGVFYDPKDIVEKSDMLRIFFSSGRLVLVDKEGNEVTEHYCCQNGNRIMLGGPIVDIYQCAMQNEDDQKMPAAAGVADDNEEEEESVKPAARLSVIVETVSDEEEEEEEAFSSQQPKRSRVAKRQGDEAVVHMFGQEDSLTGRGGVITERQTTAPTEGHVRKEDDEEQADESNEQSQLSTEDNQESLRQEANDCCPEQSQQGCEAGCGPAEKADDQTVVEGPSIQAAESLAKREDNGPAVQRDASIPGESIELEHPLYWFDAQSEPIAGVHRQPIADDEASMQTAEELLVVEEEHESLRQEIGLSSESILEGRRDHPRHFFDTHTEPMEEVQEYSVAEEASMQTAAGSPANQPPSVGGSYHNVSDNTTNGESMHSSTSTSTDTSQQFQFQNKSIPELRAIASRYEIAIPPNCLERSEIVNALICGGASASLQPYDFESWSVSELRATAAAVGVDLSHCRNREKMIAELVRRSRSDSRVHSYLESLIPLVHMTVRQLRAVAREWQVPVNDCVEKEDLIRRLVTAGPSQT
jgi:hypothetical protein